MKQRRWKLSMVQRAELWNRWKAGQSLSEIGRALGKDHVVVQFLLARHGGIAPPARHRSRRVLTLAELVYREEYATRAEAMRRELQIKRWKDRSMIERLVSASR